MMGQPRADTWGTAHANLRPISPRAFALAMKLLDLLFDGYIKGHVSGRANIPPPGQAAILAVNHSSALDTFAVGWAIRRPARFAAKIEATEYPLLGPLLLAVGAIPARRDGRDTFVLRRLTETLNDGGLVGLAPEGTRSSDGTIQRYEPGFVWLALRTRARIVPCALHGAFQLMPKGALFPKRGDVWIRFGEPLSFDGLPARPGRTRLLELAELVRSRTIDMVDDLAEASGIPAPRAREH